MRLFLTLQILFLQCAFVCFIRAQSDFSADDTSGCANFRVRFTVNNPIIGSNDTVKWYFGFGDTLRTIGKTTVDTVYTHEGKYTIVMKAKHTNPVVKVNYIKVHRAVKAFFQYEEYAAGNNYRFVPFDEITDPAASYLYTWRFRDSTAHLTIHTDNKTVNSINQNNAVDSFTFHYGLFKVSLKVDDSYGCTDFWEVPVKITDTIQIPNIFIPDKPEYYEIDPKDIGIVLHFQVFNRYGALVFEQEAPHIIWDGTTNSGRELNTGVYYYILNASQGDYLGKYTKKGFIHLFR